MIKIRKFAPLLGLLVLAACSDELQVPDFINEGLGSLIENPTRANLGSASVGLLITGRDEFDDTNGFVSLLGILGRESYNFDGSDPRFITEMLIDRLNSSSPAFGGNLSQPGDVDRLQRNGSGGQQLREPARGTKHRRGSIPAEPKLLDHIRFRLLERRNGLVS